MDKFNNVFKGLADKMKLPDFFKSNTLIFNNLFLVIVAVVVLIALLLVIFLVPGKKKKAQKAVAAEASAPAAEEEKAAPVEDTPAEEAPVEEETVTAEETVEEPAAEEIAVEEPVAEEPAAEPVVEEAPIEEAPAEEVAEEPAEEAEEAPAVVEPEVIEEPAAEEVVAAEEPAEEKKPKEEKKPTAEKKPVAKKAAPAAADAPAPKNGGKYEIVKRNGSFFFLLKANNGQLLLESTGYTTEAGAKGGIETFKNAVENGEFHIDPDKNGNYRFILRASARSQMLYHGESYSTRQSAENSIKSVKNFALRAVVKRVEEADVDDGTAVQLKPLPAAEHKAGGKLEIVERNGLFYFILKANNGQLLVESPAFTTDAGAKAGIETFKKATETGVYSIDADKNGKFRFILRAGVRAQVRYVGENYPTRQSAENSLNSVRAFAQKAVLKV